MAARKIIKVEVSPDAKDVIAETAQALGMKEVAVASRVFDWFSRQDDAIRKGVLGLLPQGHEGTFLRSVVDRLAADAEKSKGSKVGK